MRLEAIARDKAPQQPWKIEVRTPYGNFVHPPPRDGSQEELQQHGIIINSDEKHPVYLAAMEKGSLDAIVLAAAREVSWRVGFKRLYERIAHTATRSTPWKVEIRTPYGSFGYKIDKAGTRRFGVVSSRDVSGPLAELVAATAARPLSAMELEPPLKEVFTPKIVPRPVENGEYVRV
jgi:hypothetical protein